MKYVNSNKTDICTVIIVSIFTSKNILPPLNELSLMKILLYFNVCPVSCHLRKNHAKGDPWDSNSKSVRRWITAWVKLT